MNGRFYNWRMSTNPFVQVLWLIGLGVVLIGAVLIGAVILAFALGLALIAGVVFYVRLWWLRRKFQRMRDGESGRAQQGSRDSRAIEVEYTVVDELDEHDARDRRGRNPRS